MKRSPSRELHIWLPAPAPITARLFDSKGSHPQWTPLWSTHDLLCVLQHAPSNLLHMFAFNSSAFHSTECTTNKILYQEEKNPTTTIHKTLQTFIFKQGRAIYRYNIHIVINDTRDTRFRDIVGMVMFFWLLLFFLFKKTNKKKTLLIIQKLNGTEWIDVIF